MEVRVKALILSVYVATECFMGTLMIQECLFQEDKDRTGPQQCRNSKEGSGVNEKRILREAGEILEEPAQTELESCGLSHILLERPQAFTGLLCVSHNTYYNRQFTAFLPVIYKLLRTGAKCT